MITLKKILISAISLEFILLFLLILIIQAIDPISKSYWLFIGGLRKSPQIQNYSVNSNFKLNENFVGSQAIKDEFSVLADNSTILNTETVSDFEMNYGRRKNVENKINPELKYVNSFVELPLFAEDYYWGKYENAAAGVTGINKIGELQIGQKVGLIKDRYINVKSYNGFIKPQNGYYFGSGLCWSTSVFGLLMDQANTEFNKKYGIDLFLINNSAPHSHYYRTYLPSNNGRGYTVMQRSTGVAVQDYVFTLNPQIANIQELANLKIQIFLVSTSDHANAYSGQSIGGYILSNVNFDPQ